MTDIADIIAQAPDTLHVTNEQGLVELIRISTGEVLSCQKVRGGPLHDLMVKTAKYAFDRMKADLIVERIMNGEPLTKICKSDGFPRIAIVASWRDRFDEFDSAVRGAYKIRAEIFRDKAVEEANSIVNKDTAVAGKTRADIFWKSASHDNPNRFGSKVNHEHGGSVGFTLETGIRRPGDAGYVEVTEEEPCLDIPESKGQEQPKLLNPPEES